MPAAPSGWRTCLSSLRDPTGHFSAGQAVLPLTHAVCSCFSFAPRGRCRPPRMLRIGRDSRSLRPFGRAAGSKGIQERHCCCLRSAPPKARPIVLGRSFRFYRTGRLPRQICVLPDPKKDLRPGRPDPTSGCVDATAVGERYPIPQFPDARSLLLSSTCFKQGLAPRQGVSNPIQCCVLRPTKSPANVPYRSRPQGLVRASVSSAAASRAGIGPL